jgi:Tfp pilus assembly protein PilF
MIARANEKLAAGDIVLACHLADWAVAAAPDDKSAHEVRMKVYAVRTDREESTMAHGIFRSAVVESAAKAGVEAPDDKRSA